MRRILLECAYDGTAYHGFEAQNGQKTIEGELNRTLTELCGCKIQVTGASRTDSGVHALKNLAVFDTEMRMDASKFAPALNSRLPEDIRIMNSYETEPDFHPRHVRTEKTYMYSIMNTRTVIPTKRLYSHYVYVPLDDKKMDEAAQYLAGEHDFRSFCSVHTQAQSTVRTISGISVVRRGDEVIITVTGNGFLYNMVRIIAGTLLEVGRGAMEPCRVRDCLESCRRETAGPTAPARGLTLIDIKLFQEEQR